MIVDFHTHMFPEKIAAKTIAKLENIAQVKAFTDGTESGLVASMKEAGVGLSIVLPVVTAPQQFHTVNTFAAKLNETYSGKHPRLLSFGGIHPDAPDYKEQLRTVQKLGLKGIKLHPDYQMTDFDDIKYMRILDYASELGLVSVIHAGVDIGFPQHVHCTVDRICNVVREVAPKNMVLAHFGGFGLWEEVEERLTGREVYLDTAYTFGFIKDETFLRILKKHGAGNVLFATDSPWSGQKESLGYLQKLPVSKEDLDKILWQNAYRLLGIQEGEGSSGH